MNIHEQILRDDVRDLCTNLYPFGGLFKQPPVKQPPVKRPRRRLWWQWSLWWMAEFFFLRDWRMICGS